MKCKKCNTESKYGGTCHTCLALVRDKYPCYSLQKIGDEFGITRERTRQILKNESRPTASNSREINAKKKECPRCGKEKKKHSLYCRECFYFMHHVTLTCSWCGILYEDYQSQVMHKINVHKQNNFFCGKKCSGAWAGKHFGFQPKYTPGEAKQKRKEKNIKYIKSHKEEIKVKGRLWKEHTNEERISILCSLLDGAKGETNYKKLFEVINKVFPGLFVSSGSLRAFLWHHKDLFEVEKCGKITLKGK